jgi:hypothetical protein
VKFMVERPHKLDEETAQACVNAIYRELIKKSALQSRNCLSTKRLLISILFILLAENL